MKTKINVGMAENHVIMRQGIIALLKDYENISVLFDVNNGKELMEELETSSPDVILLDIDMPVMGGMEALEQISIKYPEIKVIMLSMHFSNGYIVEFIRKGAKAFLPKEGDMDKIIEAITSVYTLGHYYDERVSKVMADEITRNSEAKETELTNREREVLKLIKVNKADSEIAGILSISCRTAEWHRSNLIQKTGSKNTQDLIQWANRNI